MQDIEQATELWLDIHRAEDTEQREYAIMNAAEQGFIELEQPEPYAILLQLRNLNTTFWAGGLADQPYFLLKEMTAAANGEAKHQTRKLAKGLGTLNG